MCLKVSQCIKVVVCEEVVVVVGVLVARGRHWYFYADFLCQFPLFDSL